MKVDDGSNVGQGQNTPSKGQGHGQSLPKGQGHSSSSRTTKRRRDSDEGEGTPLKLRKTTGSFTLSKNVGTPKKDSESPTKTPGTPRFTVLKKSSDNHDGYRLVCFFVSILFMLDRLVEEKFLFVCKFYVSRSE